MRKIFLFITISTILSHTITSCSEDDLPSNPPSIIVEGWIEDGGQPIVILTTNLQMTEEYVNLDSLSDNLIRWAKVTVNDGNEEVTLTGKYDPAYFPPFIYTTGKLKGKAGSTYTLTVEYDQYHCTAITCIPTTSPNVNFILEKCTGTDSLYQIVAKLSDSPQEKNYYQFFVRTGSSNKQYLASYLGSVNDDILTPNKVHTITVNQGHSIRKYPYSPYVHEGDSIAVKCSQVDSFAYAFWDSYIKTLSLSGNYFLSAKGNVPSNIHGGEGYWCGYNSKISYFIVGKKSEE